MTPQDFEAIVRMLRERSGVVLEPGKEYLVETRLAPVLRRLGFRSISELVARLRWERDNGLSRQVVEAMVTTESSFFRDHHPFEALRKVVIPEIVARRRAERGFNVWCAACSTGQEPYSVAILLREHFPELAGWRVRILATDISTDVLARAREGRYNQIEVNRGLPAALLLKHFDQQGTDWQLKASVRAMVEFRELNLAGPWPLLPTMDLVLVRNVMIYFDVETKKAILGRVAQVLHPEGYLVLGGAETTFQLNDAFRRVEPLKSGCYRFASQTTI